MILSKVLGHFTPTNKNVYHMAASTRETVHYMYFALAAYGWPMYLLHNKTVPVPSAAWKLCTSLRYRKNSGFFQNFQTNCQPSILQALG